MPDPANALLKDLLERFYRPAGHRLGIVILAEGPPAAAAVAAEVLSARGQVPARRLARLQPRPDEPSVRPQDVADFLRRYGHEYSVVWFPAGGALRAEVSGITAAAHQAGCAIGWDLTGCGAEGEPLEADFALHGTDVYVRPRRSARRRSPTPPAR
jgi:kynureninase